MEIIHQAPPSSSSFTPLALHQSQTPESFFSGPPVLHHHSPSASLVLRSSDLAAAPVLAGLANGARTRGAVNGETVGGAVNGDGVAVDGDEDGDEEVEIEGVDVWVSSEYVCLFLRTELRFVRQLQFLK